MNHEEEDNNSQFKLRLDKEPVDREESALPPEINELKLEKISQRVTLISILIPVLIVIVLVITYLDIKKRVTQTEDIGAIEFRKLSSDLESRFSSLSVRQAKIEEVMEKMTEQSTQASAAIQVQLGKMNDAFKEMRQNAVGSKEFNATKSEFNATKAELVKQINGVVDASNQAGEQMAAISQALKQQMDELNRTVSSAGQQLSGLDKKMTEIDQKKIDKPALDLALKLENLKLENSIKAQIDALQTKIRTLENQLARRGAERPSTAQPATPAAPNASGSTAASPSGTTPRIVEQPITQ
jgi:methyl-accepting chemotaxis protein